MPPPPLPNTLPPDRDTLPALLAGMLRDEDLGIIARADYGWRADENLAALHRLVHDRDLALGASVPSEVLELTCWSTPADGRDGVQEHRCRAFACAVLLRALCQKESSGFLTGIEDILIRLVDSLSALDRLAPSCDPGWIDAPAAAFLTSIIPALPSNSDNLDPFFGLALLWFALATEVPDDALVTLTDWIMVTEQEAPSYSARMGWPLPGPWLIDKSFHAPDRLWQVYGTALPKRLSARHGAGITEAVHLIAAMLEPS